MDGAVVVFDLTDPQSLDSAKNFFEEIYDVVESVPSVLIGNKSDLDHEFSDTEIKMIENNFNIKYFEVFEHKDKTWHRKWIIISIIFEISAYLMIFIGLFVLICIDHIL